MADRYWVGGTGTWDATTTTNWATTSGGAGGASAPTSADNVIFDSLSNANLYTVTIGTNAVCKDWTVDAPLVGNVTFAGTSNISIYGSLTWPVSGMTRVYSGINQFFATTTGNTITTNGVSFGSRAIFDGVGGEWTLGSALTTTSASALAVNILNGTFDTGNYNVTCSAGGFTIGAGTKTVNLGSSTISTNIASGGLTATETGTTLNAGTSLFSIGASSPTFAGGGLTYYNVSFTSASAGTATITGDNTFNDLTFTSRSATGLRFIVLSNNQTVNGTLTLGTANTAIRRILVTSATIGSGVGTQRTITLNGTLATLSDVDFRDIATAGTVGTWTGTRLGNCLGNSGITFDAPKTVYWNLAGTQNWSETGWATTNNGTPDVNNFPLAQDTATFTEVGSAGTINYNLNWQVGTIQMADGVSNRTTAFTLANSTIQAFIYGNVTLFSSLTLAGTAALNFNGQGTTQTITSAGVTFTQPITINSPLGTVTLADNFTGTNLTAYSSSAAAFKHLAGTLDLTDKTITLSGSFGLNAATAPRTLAFGTSGKIVSIANSMNIFSASEADTTITGTSRFEAAYSGSVGTRSMGGARFMNIYVTAGSDIIVLTASSSVAYGLIDFTGFTGTLATSSSSGVNVEGDFILNSSLTFSPLGSLDFRKESGTQKITSAGKVFSGVSFGELGGDGVYELQDNLTVSSALTTTLTGGTLDLDGNILTTGAVSTSNSNTRSIDFGANGVIDSAGAWTATTATGLTTAGRGRIKMSSASAKTFAGGGANYAGVTLEQAGAGTLTITGANTFDDIANSNATASQITFPASTTTYVKRLTVSGSEGNLVALRSSSSGTQFTIETV